MLKPELILGTLSDYLSDEETDLDFARSFADELNMILLTAPETSELRRRLRYLETVESLRFFERLYKSWCHSPTSALSLCLLSGCDFLAGDLAASLGSRVLSNDTMHGLDRLARLVESPAFPYLRMRLLDTANNDELVYALNSVLMLMPQTDAFHKLRTRLEAAANIRSKRPFSSKAAEPKSLRGKLDFKDLERIFEDRLDRYEATKTEQRLKFLRDRGVRVVQVQQPLLMTLP